MSVENLKTGVFFTELNVKTGDKIVVSTAGKQQDTLRGVYTLLGMPGEGDKKEEIGAVEKFISENPNHIATRVYNIFNNPDMPVYTPPQEAGYAWKMVTKEWLEDQTDENLTKAKDLLLQLQGTNSPIEQRRIREAIYFSFGLEGDVEESFRQARKAFDEKRAIDPKIILALDVHSIIESNTDGISPDLVKEAKKLVENSTEPESLAANKLLDQMTQIRTDETLTIASIVGKGGTAVVVHAQKEGEADKVGDRVFKIIFPTSGEKYSTPERALHVSKIQTRLKSGSVALDVYESINLPHFYYEGDITLDGVVTRTIISELSEAKGVEFADWTPESIGQYIAVTKRITDVVNYLHGRGIVNVDSGAAFVNTEEINTYLKSPKDYEGSFLDFFDLDEAIITNTNRAPGEPELFYPISLDPGAIMMGKPSNWNPLLIDRDFNKPISLNAAKWIDTHNFMFQFFNKLSGNVGLDHVSKNSPCYVDTSSSGYGGKAIGSAYLFPGEKSYPLISQQEFISGFNNKFGETTKIDDGQLEMIYKQFKGYFDAYHSQSQNMLDNGFIDLDKAEPIEEEFSGRMELILSILNQDPEALASRATTTAPAVKDEVEKTLVLANPGIVTEEAIAVVGGTTETVELVNPLNTLPAAVFQPDDKAATRRMKTLEEMGLKPEGTPIEKVSSPTPGEGMSKKTEPAAD